jgi:hypothetical protein
MKIRVDVPEWDEEKETRYNKPRDGVRVALFVEIFNKLTDENGEVEIDDSILPSNGTTIIYRARSLGTLPFETVFEDRKDYMILVVKPDPIVEGYIAYTEQKQEEKLFAAEWMRKRYMGLREMWGKFFGGDRD